MEVGPAPDYAAGDAAKGIHQQRVRVRNKLTFTFCLIKPGTSGLQLFSSLPSAPA